MRSRSVSARDGVIVFVAVLTTAVYVYAVLLAASPDRVPAPALPDPWRLVDTIGRVVGGLQSAEAEQRATQEPAAAAVPFGESAAGRRTVATLAGGADLRSEQGDGEPAAPVRPPGPSGSTGTPAGPGAHGQAKGHGKKGSKPHASARGRERRSAAGVAKASRGHAVGRPPHAHTPAPPKAGRRHSIRSAHVGATGRSDRARTKAPPQRGRGHARRSQRNPH